MDNKYSHLGFADFLLSSEEDTTVFGRSASWITRFDSELDDWICAGAGQPEEKRAEAAARIASCRDHNLTRLDLSRLELSSLPDCIAELQQLEWLVLVSNKLTFLPDWVGNLRDLVGLYASCNQLAQLPETLADLGRLEHLRLDYNQLENLPEAIAQLRSLKQISLGHNRIEKLPESLWSLPSLDAETLITLPRMEQENRIAHLEHKASSLSSLLNANIAGGVPAGAFANNAFTDHSFPGAAASAIDSAIASKPDYPHDPTPETAVPSAGLMGLLALQRVQLASEESALRDEIDSLRDSLHTDIEVQKALLG